MSEENKENPELNKETTNSSSADAPELEEKTSKDLEPKANQESQKKKKKKKGSYSMHKTKSVVITKGADDNSESAQIPFPAAAHLLECAKDEYTKERERTQFLDNKASFFMSAVILVATVFIPIIPFGKFVSFALNNSDCKLCFFILVCLALVTAFTLLIISFKKLYDAYAIKGYSRFNIDNVDDQQILAKDKNTIEVALCENYKKSVVENIRINNAKADDVKLGIKLSAIGFLLIAISAIALVILVGA